MQPRSKARIFFYILMGAVSFVLLGFFYKYIPLLFISASFAVVLYPVYQWFNRRVTNGKEWLASFLTILLFIFIIGVPLFLIGTRIFSEASALYKDLLSTGFHSDYLDSLNLKLQSAFPGVPPINLKGNAGAIISFFVGAITTIFRSTIHTLFSFVLMFFSLFYFLKDGKSWKKYIIELSPLSSVHDERILTMLGRAINGVMLGYVLVALTQGLLLGLGLFVFGVPNAALLGLAAGIASLIPSIGTALISIPSVLYLFAIGHNAEGLGLMVWAAFLVGTIDNFLSPVLVGRRIELSPLLMLFSILGAVSLLGAAGVVIGPLTVSVMITLIKIYKEDFN